MEGVEAGQAPDWTAGQPSPGQPYEGVRLDSLRFFARRATLEICSYELGVGKYPNHGSSADGPYIEGTLPPTIRR